MTDVNERKIIAVGHELRTWGAVAIVGSGASLQSGFPLVAQLQTLVWHALDADEELRTNIAKTNAWSGGTAREMIEDDPVRTRIALEVIAANHGARNAYQHGFAQLNSERSDQPSPAHAALAELLHRRAVETVISFNWDTLLETAYRRRYGRALNVDGRWLHKPHGDAAHPELDWVLPHETGVIPDEVIRQVREMTSARPRVLLIVGYSESDDEIVNNLIAPLAGRWRVVRVGPTARGESDITMVAEQALPALARAIFPGPEVTGWEYVNFEGQHDLGSALAGERLGPKDVTACPRLPEVNAVGQRLAVTNSAVIVGTSGCGKSITAYQSAYDLHQDGWEVLRLVNPSLSSDELLLSISNLPYRTTLIVDDAQSVSESLTRRLIEDASEERKVIVITTDEMPSQTGPVRVAGERAVATIADTLKSNRRKETLEVVRQLDRRVGEGYIDTSLEWRIEEAAKEETPWKFSYVLTGGEWRSREGIAALRDVDRADLLLATVAAGQLVSSDRGASRAWLERAAQALDRDTDWLETSLRVLRERRFVIGDGSYRCTHQRFAAVALESIYSLRREPEWDALTRMLRAALRYETPPLGGIHQLLYATRRGSHFPGAIGERETVVDDDMWHRLTERCWVAQHGIERRDALGVLTELLDWHPRTVEAIATRTELFGEWLESTDASAATNFRWFLNNVSLKDARSVVEEICDRADPALLAASIAKATWSEAYAWGALLDRLWMAREEWRRRLLSALDLFALRNLLRSIPSSHLYQLEQLLDGLRSLDKNLAVQLTDEVLPMLANAVNANPAAAFHDIHDVVWSVLGYPPASFMRVPISRRQKAVARRFALSLDPIAIGRAISVSKQRDWHILAELLLFLRQTARSQADAVAAAIDFESMDRITQGMWEGPVGELVKLIDMLDPRSDDGPNPVRSWVARHAKDYGHLDTTLAMLVPEEAVARLHAGQTLDLGLARGGWIGALLALASIDQVDEPLAIRVLETNQPALSEALVTIDKWDCPVVEVFFRALEKATSRILTAAIEATDPDKARKNWTNLLRGKAAEKRAVATIIDAAASAQGPIASVIADLRRQFPQAAKSKAKVITN
jgi:hypothetical protein